MVMASIFVQIASYHDFELPKTVYDAVKKSSGHHTICFGIHQVYKEDFQILIPKVPNFRMSESQAPKDIGVGRARHLANKHYAGQDYYLQVDAHTRFYPGWDEALIDNIKKLQEQGVAKPLLTAYPSSYIYNDRLEEYSDWDRSVTSISFSEKPDQFASSLIPSQLAVQSEGLVKQTSVSAGFIFTLGEFAKLDVNQKIMFWGEEILIAARAFTHGFDLYIPDKQYIYHLYYDHTAVWQKNMRSHVWKDYPNEYSTKDAESKAEVYDILSTQRIGPEALGDERSLNDYGNWAGLDFINRTVK
jgi:hypothetical protein